VFSFCSKNNNKTIKETASLKLTKYYVHGKLDAFKNNAH
jgi:hypothetical protein